MAKYIECERIRKAVVGACLMNQNCPMFIAAKIDQMIDCEPAADVVPVVHGRWIYGEFDIPHCSECGNDVMPNMISPYCPNCGAKMDEEENDNV